MRPALLLLGMLAIASLSSRSQADPVPPTAVLLECDTVSVNPLQVHFQFGLQNPPTGNFAGLCTIYFTPVDPATHILSCSATAPGASCSPYAPYAAVWYLSTCILPGQSVGAFDFVADHSPACFHAEFADPLLGTSGPRRPEGGTRETLCFSCVGIDAVPVLPSTWGSLKGHYR